MKLKDWLDDEKMTGTEFGDRIGVSQGAVSKIARGAFWPAAETIAAIERETKGKVTAADILETYQAAQAARRAAEQTNGAGAEA
jgi:transcriptional regulator with XRE-family HTH domain